MLEQAPELRLIGLTGIPEIRTGDDLAVLIVEAAARLQLAFQSHDILGVTQKVVSKMEGRVVALRDIMPSPASLTWAAHLDKDPWTSPGQNTAVGSLSLLQGIFLTQGSNPGFCIAGRFFSR